MAKMSIRIMPMNSHGCCAMPLTPVSLMIPIANHALLLPPPPLPLMFSLTDMLPILLQVGPVTKGKPGISGTGFIQTPLKPKGSLLRDMA